MKIERFEDIEGWQQARLLTRYVYTAAKKTRFARDYGLKDQIQRAAVSSISNSAEGFDSGSNAEFVKFLRYAQRSCTEVQSTLYVALDQEYITQQEFQSVYTQAAKTRSLLGGLIKYLLAYERSKAATKNQERRTKNALPA